VPGGEPVEDPAQADVPLIALNLPFLTPDQMASLNFDTTGGRRLLN